VVILTVLGRPGFLRRALAARVSGFLVKDAPSDELIDALRRVAAGERVIDPQVALAVSGSGLVSRWPMSEPVLWPLRGEDGSGSGSAVHVIVDGERGPIQLFLAMLDYPLGASALRQAQVKELARFIQPLPVPFTVCRHQSALPGHASNHCNAVPAQGTVQLRRAELDHRRADRDVGQADSEPRRFVADARIPLIFERRAHEQAIWVRSARSFIVHCYGRPLESASLDR
jgi:hypothetical protein